MKDDFHDTTVKVRIAGVSHVFGVSSSEESSEISKDGRGEEDGGAKVWFDFGVHSCGSIRDGIAFGYVDVLGNYLAGGVLSFEDLRAVYLAASAVRRKLT